MRFLLAILFFSFVLFIEKLTFPLVEHFFGRQIFPHGLGVIILPLICGFIGWVVGDILIRQKRGSKRRVKILTPRAQLYLGIIIIWETLVLSYLLVTKSLVNQTSLLQASTLIFLIIFPPLILMSIYLLIFMMSKLRYVKEDRFKETVLYVKENLNTFPVFLQIIAALLLLSTLMIFSPDYQQLVSIFIFVSAIISVWDSSTKEEFNFSTLFILIACLYNPVYPIHLNHSTWLILNTMIAFLFVYKVSLIWITEQNLEKNLKKIAKKIDWVLKELDRNTNDYTSEMLGVYLKNKYSSALIKGSTITWQERSLPHFTFSRIEVFNGESAIRVSGKDAFTGFHTLLVFYNQTFKYMIFLEFNATITAKRLKKIMTQDFGYFEYNRNLPGAAGTMSNK